MRAGEVRRNTGDWGLGGPSRSPLPDGDSESAGPSGVGPWWRRLQFPARGTETAWTSGRPEDLSGPETGTGVGSRKTLGRTPQSVLQSPQSLQYS